MTPADEGMAAATRDAFALTDAALELAEAWWAWRKAPVLTVEEAEANLRRRHAEEAFAKIKREQGGGA